MTDSGIAKILSEVNKAREEMLTEILFIPADVITGLLLLPPTVEQEITQAEKIGKLQETEATLLTLSTKISDYSAKLQQYQTARAAQQEENTHE